MAEKEEMGEGRRRDVGKIKKRWEENKEKEEQHYMKLDMVFSTNHFIFSSWTIIISFFQQNKLTFWQACT